MADQKPRAQRLPSPPEPRRQPEPDRASRHDWQPDDVEVLEEGEPKPEK